MKFSTIFLPSALFALAQAQTQMPCAANATLPCLCPAGTEYAESGTFFIGGVPIKYMVETLGDFYNTNWLKRPLISTTGTNNTAGATRITRISTNVGSYNFKETLTSYQAAPDGSFKLLYEQTEPVKYKNGRGQFAGWWHHVQSENAFPYESPMRWSLFACQTGHPIDFAGFAEDRLNELAKGWKEQGLVKGDNLGPLSFQRF